MEKDEYVLWDADTSKFLSFNVDMEDVRMRNVNWVNTLEWCHRCGNEFINSLSAVLTVEDHGLASMELNMVMDILEVIAGHNVYVVPVILGVVHTCDFTAAEQLCVAA